MPDHAFQRVIELWQMLIVERDGSCGSTDGDDRGAQPSGGMPRRSRLPLGSRLWASQHPPLCNLADDLLVGALRLPLTSPTFLQQHQSAGATFAHLRLEVMSGLLPGLALK